MSDVKIPNYPELANYKPVEDFDGDTDTNEVCDTVIRRKDWFEPRIPDVVSDKGFKVSPKDAQSILGVKKES